MHAAALALRRTGVLLCAWLLGPAHAALDTTSLTDDHSINSPTACSSSRRPC